MSPKKENRLWAVLSHGLVNVNADQSLGYMPTQSYAEFHGLENEAMRHVQWHVRGMPK